jgi:hypothetical protein
MIKAMTKEHASRRMGAALSDVSLSLDASLLCRKCVLGPADTRLLTLLLVSIGI